MENESAQVQMPAESLLEQRIQEYLDAHWEEVVADIDALVCIPSFEDHSAAAEGAPYGPGPRAALSAALDLAKRMGFETHDDEGYVGYADFAGKADTQLGIIGHMDVVPAGPGWHFEPFAVTRKDGYLVGRGVIDDKGPCVVALHAMNLWRALQQAGEAPRLPYTLRFIFGANEETGMGDVRYYRAHHADPAFLFTPDAEFPVCYGEKGIYNGLLTSANLPVETRSVILFEGGTAINAVPGHAQAVVWADAEKASRCRRHCGRARAAGRGRALAGRCGVAGGGAAGAWLVGCRCAPGAHRGHGTQRARKLAGKRRERHRAACELPAEESPGRGAGARLFPRGRRHRGFNGRHRNQPGLCRRPTSISGR